MCEMLGRVVVWELSGWGRGLVGAWLGGLVSHSELSYCE